MSENYQNRLILENIKKSYNNKIVLDIKRSVIPLNGIIAIIGWSGSGKSTLLNIISLIDYPDIDTKSLYPPIIEIHINETTYRVSYKRNGNPVIHWKTKENEAVISASDFRKILFGFVFQHHYLHPNFNLEYNIKTPLLSQKKTIEKDKLKIICEYLDINNQLFQYVSEVSGGQAQRASILRAMIKNCPVILGDELTSNIDYQKARQILDEFKKSVYDKTNDLKAFIWVSHDIHLIKEYAETIITIQDCNIQCVKNKFNSFDEILNLLQKQNSQQISAAKKYTDNHRNMAKDKNHFDQHLKTDTSPITMFNQNGSTENHETSFYFSHKPSTLKEQFSYYVTYALNDLFIRRIISPIKSIPQLSIKARIPVVDFSIVVLSLTVVVLFLFSILKISYGSHKFLEIKLSDPRINSIEISGNENIGGELTEKHLNDLKNSIGHLIKYVTPIYYVRTSLKEVSSNQFKSNGNAITFRRDDPIIREILGQKHAPFISDEKQIKGLIIQESSIRRFGYQNTDKQVTAKFNGYNEDGTQKISILRVNTPLPFNKKIMMREEFYIESYKKQNSEEKPYISYIVIYPKTIYDTVAIKNKIEKFGIFDINDAFKVMNKLAIIDEIKKQTQHFVAISIFAIGFISLFVIAVTIYRNLYKKRNEMGVFLSYGMNKSTFFVFYFIEVLLITISTVLLSLIAYYFVIEPIINTMLTEGGLLKMVNTVNYNTAMNSSLLSLPLLWINMIYLIVFFVLLTIFFYIIYGFIRQKPILLMRD